MNKNIDEEFDKAETYLTLFTAYYIHRQTVYPQTMLS